MKVLRMLILLGALVLLFSCGNDDDPDFEVIPPRRLSEVVTEDAATLQEYLQTHFYNYEDFENPPAGFDFRIVLDTIAGDNAGKIPLIDRPELQSLTIPVSSDDFNLENDETVDHTMYYLVARDGVGGIPTLGDSTLVRYEGTLLTGALFDATASYTWQYLPFFLKGYSRAISRIKTGDGVVVNPDGTTEITNAGVGAMFLPSGLAYYNASVPGVPQYSPLIFKVEVGFYVEDTDYDNDGIPSLLEDLNGDGDLTNDNTDREQERATGALTLANHVDSDDDQDGTPTRDEIIIDDQGNISFPDSDGDGTPDYLDRDSS